MIFSTHGDWIPRGMPSVLKISKKGGHLAGTLIFKRTDGELLAILLGSTGNFGVGFNAVSESETGMLDDRRCTFEPKAPEQPSY